MNKIKEIADAADMIINGYSFTKENGMIRVCNLNNIQKACILDENGLLLETSMDDIELSIVDKYFSSNRSFLEV